MTTTSIVKQGAYPKEVGWCDEQGLSHAWEAGPTYTVDPPIQTRRCKNCGKTQNLQQPQWKDH